MSTPFKMKGAPYAGETSPLKQWYNPFNREVKGERKSSTSTGEVGGETGTTETKSKTYRNILTGNRVVKKKETTTPSKESLENPWTPRKTVKTTKTKLQKYGKKKSQGGYDTREYKASKQKVVKKTTYTKAGFGKKGKYVHKEKTTTTDPRKMEDK